ncbi:hypothetical protein MLD38_037064 [Melastoma candidum]|uniref:Uncharacterized protein n=1 Tax=Melastoma candidum TaxID=119954 RepID=A0ACB9LMC1_9MYRT|nr:hypothetical protein MLD38_037064 [Melastoma candidum]
MVDEAHERSISTDIVLGLLKKIQRRRSDLRLIISSATIEAKSMSDFFQPRYPFNVRCLQRLIVLPLYWELPRAEQDLIFSPTPRGKRKVVISTNIAETSLTWEGVVYVVDSGFSKQKFYNSITDIENLVVAPTSQASARQRAGRAGRVRPGKCYRLYTEEYFLKEMPAQGIPEIQRSNLVSCIIQVLDDDAKLISPVGFHVAEIPLEPMISKMILSSNQLGCSEEILTISAVLSVQSIWVTGRGVRKEFDEAKMRFAAAEGDHVTFLNVYKGFLESGKSSNWCYKNYINYHAMKKVVEIREQLQRIAQRLGIDLKSFEGNLQAVRKAVTAGFFANACRLEPYSHNGMYKTLRASQEVYIHPSSVLFRVNPNWVLYQSIVSTDRRYMRNVISIEPSWLTEVAPHFYQKQGL